MFDQQKCAQARREKYLQRCEELFNQIDLDEFIQYYNSHYDKETMEKFGLTSTQLHLFCTKHHIQKTTERFKLLSYQSRLQKYGQGTYRNTNKAKATRLHRYGDENYNNKQKISETHLSKTDEQKTSSNNKRKETCMKKFGYESSSQCPEVKERTRQTNISRYGVDWYCMTPECRNFSSNESRTNLMFQRFLDDNNIEYIREFPIDQYSYDFKVGRYLIELDPFPYHNITWNPFNDSRTNTYYHQKKSMKAASAGFVCIHVFDWMKWEEVLAVVQSDVRIKEFTNPRKFILDVSTLSLVDEEGTNTVVIFDDGAIYE